MATEILVNDGGAPARIMNLGAANADIEAGLFVDINSAGKIIACADDAELDADSGHKKALGVLFVDAVSGAPTSIITGRGVVCNVQVTEDIPIGSELTLSGTPGKLEVTADSGQHNVVAIGLAASFVGYGSDGTADATDSWCKVLLV
tara:strand:- start:698 stop:1138 length:441 start_codon:yes stop_codon:yes gene_type:complete